MESILSFKLFNLIKESQVYSYRKIVDREDSIKYLFDANGIPYFVNIWHDNSTHNYRQYEIDFGFENQKHSGDVTKRDLKHLNSVLITVCEIMENEVEDKKIKYVKVEGAGGESDNIGMFNSTIKSKMYYRFLSNRYGSENVNHAGRYINVNTFNIFPNIFSKDNKSRKDLVLDEILRINDNPDNIDGIERGVYGIDDSKFGISTDFIDNNEKGGINIEIGVWDQANEYEMSWEYIDDGGEGDKNFNSFEELLNFLKKFPS